MGNLTITITLRILIVIWHLRIKFLKLPRNINDKEYLL